MNSPAEKNILSSSLTIMTSLFIMVILIFFSSCTYDEPIEKEGFLPGAGDTKLHYRIMGSQKDTVVVVHGGPGAGMHTVIPMMKPLTEMFTLIFYDQRGGGLSTLPDDTTQLQPYHFVDDLEAVRKYFGLEQMNIITHSFGSILVAEYAKKYPDCLNRMVFHASTGPDRSEAGKYYRAQAAAATQSPDTALANQAAELLQSLLNGTASDPVKTCQHYEWISRQLVNSRGDSTSYRGTTCNAPPEAVRYYYRYTAQLAPRYFGDWNYIEDLKEISVPLMVIYGEQDTLGIPMQQQWVNAIQNGKLLLVSDAGKGGINRQSGGGGFCSERFF